MVGRSGGARRSDGLSEGRRVSQAAGFRLDAIFTQHEFKSIFNGEFVTIRLFTEWLTVI